LVGTTQIQVQKAVKRSGSGVLKRPQMIKTKLKLLKSMRKMVDLGKTTDI